MLEVKEAIYGAKASKIGECLLGMGGWWTKPTIFQSVYAWNTPINGEPCFYTTSSTNPSQEIIDFAKKKGYLDKRTMFDTCQTCGAAAFMAPKVSGRCRRCGFVVEECEIRKNKFIISDYRSTSKSPIGT